MGEKDRLACRFKVAAAAGLLATLACLSASAGDCADRAGRKIGLSQAEVMHDSYLKNSQDAADFVETMYLAADALKQYSFSYEMTAFHHNETVTEKGLFWFKKEHRMRIEVTAGPKKGAVAVVDKDGKVHGHLGGALRYFKATVSPDSGLLRSVNGYPMVDSDFASIYDYLRKMLKEGDRSRVTFEPVNVAGLAQKVHIVEMYRGNPDHHELVLKRIFVDPASYLPLAWEDYVDGQKLSYSIWHDLKTNVEIDDGIFTL